MIIPPKLKAGDTVGVVAPARKISPRQLEPALITFQSWGLNFKLAKNIFSDNHSYLAGTDEERSADMQSMVNDPDVSAIFCARGGYGSTRIIDDIDFSPLKKLPKWLIGFSDVTAFQLRLLKMDIPTVHATMPIFYGRPESQGSVESIRRLLFEGMSNIEAPPSPFNRAGRATGQLIGGNLSLIMDAMNTPSDPDTNNKILIVEEVDEYLYKLDRMFTQLRRAGKLANLAGLVVGHMTDMKNSDLLFADTIEEIVLHAVRDYPYPVAFDFPSGHQDPNQAWVQGAEAVLDVSLTGVTLHHPDIYRAKE